MEFSGWYSRLKKRLRRSLGTPVSTPTVEHGCPRLGSFDALSQQSNRTPTVYGIPDWPILACPRRCVVVFAFSVLCVGREDRLAQRIDVFGHLWFLSPFIRPTAYSLQDPCLALVPLVSAPCREDQQLLCFIFSASVCVSCHRPQVLLQPVIRPPYCAFLWSDMT